MTGFSKFFTVLDIATHYLTNRFRLLGSDIANVWDNSIHFVDRNKNKMRKDTIFLFKDCISIDWLFSPHTSLLNIFTTYKYWFKKQVESKQFEKQKEATLERRGSHPESDLFCLLWWFSVPFSSVHFLVNNTISLFFACFRMSRLSCSFPSCWTTAVFQLCLAEIWKIFWHLWVCFSQPGYVGS